MHELLDRHGLTREEVAPLLDGLTQAELELLDDLLVLSANAYDERHGWGARAEFLRAIKERIRQQFLSAGVTTAD